MRKSHDQTAIARQVRTLFEVGAVGHLSDRELLDRFADREGLAAEAAFEALVERHGPMVLRACRAIVRDPDEADDAFQSTFLLLARRAGSLWVRDSLAPWLHSVACRISHGRRVAEARRRGFERRFAARLARSTGEPPRDDLGLALHEEIERLPERLKAPVVLCHLEGLTHEMAAEHLNCPVGTVRSRLSRGRERLRRALTRQGFAPGSSDSNPQALPAVPASLASLTLHAVRLASGSSALGLLSRWSILVWEGVVKTMMIHPLKSAAVILLASGAVAVGLGATSGQEPKPPEKPAQAENSARDQSAIDRRFEALERRIKELEQKLQDVAVSPRPTIRRPEIDQNTLIKIRMRFDDALVEKVYVGVGESVKKGEPILLVRSAELAVTKNQCRADFVQWAHDLKILNARRPLAADGQITESVWIDTQNDEKKSRLQCLASRDRLLSYGITGEQLETLVRGLGDDRQKALAPVDEGMDISRMTVVSPIDGIVVERDVVPGNYYDQTNILLQIAPPKRP